MNGTPKSAGHPRNPVVGASGVPIYRANCNLKVGASPSDELAGVEFHVVSAGDHEGLAGCIDVAPSRYPALIHDHPFKPYPLTSEAMESSFTL